MKRSVFIIIATVLTLTLIAVWVYLLFFRVDGGPNEEFSNLNLNDTTDTNFETTVTEPEPTIDVVNEERIRQLTTGAVVGYTETTNDLGEAVVNYVEAGTGHIYQINLVTGAEDRISATTFANIKNAAMTDDGQNIMIETGSGSNKEFVLGRLSSSTGEFSFDSIVESIVDVATTKNNTFLFTSLIDGGLTASQYYPNTSSSEILFNIPFREAVVRFGENATSSHYIYPKASVGLDGYLYLSNNGGFERLPISGRGLTAIGDDDHVFFAHQENSQYVTKLMSLNEEVIDITDLSLVLNILPDKCTTYSDAKEFICATNNTTFDNQVPDNWYIGLESYADDLWQLNPNNLVYTKLIDITDEVGRDLDIINLQVSVGQENLYFQNKNDQTLWMFTLPARESEVIDSELSTSSNNGNNI